MSKEYISITYENNVFYCTKNGTKWISVDGEKWYGEEKRIKELELELTVEKDLHQEEINLHLHAEEYIKSLEKENNKLLDVINNQDVKIADLEKQIERMKCCANCEKYFVDCKMEDITEEEYFRANAFCKHWELRR